MDDNFVRPIKIIVHCPECDWKNYFRGETETKQFEKVFIFQQVCYGCGCHFDIQMAFQLIREPDMTSQINNGQIGAKCL